MVGMNGFEPSTFRPPDERANRAALHPDGVRQFLHAKNNDKDFFSSTSECG